MKKLLKETVTLSVLSFKLSAYINSDISMSTDMQHEAKLDEFIGKLNDVITKARELKGFIQEQPESSDADIQQSIAEENANAIHDPTWAELKTDFFNCKNLNQ